MSAPHRPGALLPACLAVALLVPTWAGHIASVPHVAGDDARWIAHAREGFGTAWTTPSPFRHYRPAFGSWLRLVLLVVGDAPGALLASGLAIHGGAAVATYLLARTHLPSADGAGALAASAIVAVHPALMQHVLWASGQLDGLCFLAMLLVLVAATHLQAPLPAALAAGCGTALAVLTKEIALALPLVLLLAPGVRRRGAVVASSLAGAAVAAGAGLLVLQGLGRTEAMLAAPRPRAMLLYPVRLVWPFDLAVVFYERSHGGGAGALALAAVATAVVAGTLAACAWRGGQSSGWPALKLAAILLAAGALPWLWRQDDRAIGLGVAGFAIAVGGLVVPRRRGALVPLLLALAWLPLWRRASDDWTRASAISGDVARAVAAWRAESPDRRLVAAGGVARLPSSAEVAGISELDPCAMDLVTVIAYGQAEPIAWSRAGDGVSIAARGATRLRWGAGSMPEIGVLAVEPDAAGYPVAMRLDPARDPLPDGGCGPAELRVWTGTAYVRP